MTIRMLKDMMPGITDARLASHGEALLAAMVEADVTTPLRQAHFIAQVGHESADLRWLEELADGEAYEGRVALGNIQPGDGRRFKGRGLIQLTGRTNYRTFGAFVGRDLLADPAAVSREPELAVRSATWFWTVRKLNSLADRDDFLAVTKRINGGTNGLDDRRRRLGVAKRVLGVAV